LFSVIATTVRQRTRELAVRVALGATPGDLWRAVLVQGLSLAAVGAALGILASLATMRALESLLFGVRPVDVPTFTGVCVLLLGVAVLAALVPARHAQRTDPMLALRAE
jgi:ABC-type antimicrobial peptide transport system permease subunit